MVVATIIEYVALESVPSNRLMIMPLQVVPVRLIVVTTIVVTVVVPVSVSVPIPIVDYTIISIYSIIMIIPNPSNQVVSFVVVIAMEYILQSVPHRSNYSKILINLNPSYPLMVVITMEVVPIPVLLMVPLMINQSWQ